MNKILNKKMIYKALFCNQNVSVSFPSVRDIHEQMNTFKFKKKINRKKANFKEIVKKIVTLSLNQHYPFNIKFLHNSVLIFFLY